LTGAGSFTITRNAQNGLPKSLNGGSLNQARTFNGYGGMDKFQPSAARMSVREALHKMITAK